METTIISLDTETGGIQTGSVVYQIGAKCLNNGALFSVYISPASCLRAGLLMDVSTQEWWAKQDQEIRARVQGGTVSLQEALTQFTAWIDAQTWTRYAGGENFPKLEVWMNSPSFDSEKILGPAYKVCGWPGVPWKYHQERDFRTLAAWYGDYQKPEGAHDALVDAIAQGDYIAAKLKEIRK